MDHYGGRSRPEWRMRRRRISPRCRSGDDQWKKNNGSHKRNQLDSIKARVFAVRLIRGLSRKSSPAHSSTNSNTSPHQYTLLIQGGIDQDRCKFYSDSRAFEGTKFPCGELYPLRAPSPAQPVIFFSFPDHSRKKEGNKKKISQIEGEGSKDWSTWFRLSNRALECEFRIPSHQPKVPTVSWWIYIDIDPIPFSAALDGHGEHVPTARQRYSAMRIRQESITYSCYRAQIGFVQIFTSSATNAVLKHQRCLAVDLPACGTYFHLPVIPDRAHSFCFPI